MPARPEWLAIRTNPCWSWLEAGGDEREVKRPHRVEPAPDLRKEVVQRPVDVGPSLAYAIASRERPDQVLAVEQPRPAAAAFGGSIAPSHDNRVEHGPQIAYLEIALAQRSSGGVLHLVAARMVEPVHHGRMEHGIGAPAGVRHLGRNLTPEAQQGGVLCEGRCQQVRAAVGHGEPLVDLDEPASRAPKEPPRLHGVRDLGVRHAVVGGEEIGNEGVIEGVVQQGPGADEGAFVVVEHDRCHRVCLGRRKPPLRTLHVDVIAAVEPERVERGRLDRAVDMGDLPDAERERGQRVRGRQGDLHPDGVALHDRRPQGLGGGVAQGERQAGQRASGPGHFGLRGGRREQSRSAVLGDEIDRADDGIARTVGPLVRLPVEEAELACIGQLDLDTHPHRRGAR